MTNTQAAPRLTEGQAYWLLLICCGGLIPVSFALGGVRGFETWYLHASDAHAALELFAVCAALMIASLAWHTVDKGGDHAGSVLLLGLPVIGVCGLAHLLTQPGMAMALASADVRRSELFAVLGHFFESLTIAAVAFNVRFKLSKAKSLLAALLLTTLVLGLGAIPPDEAPAKYLLRTNEHGVLTSFEALYLLVSSTLAVALQYRCSRGDASPQPWLLAKASALLALGSFVMLGVDVIHAPLNIAAHLYKGLAFILLYRATFVSGLLAPYAALKISEARALENQTRLNSLAGNLPNIMLYQLSAPPGGPRKFTQITGAVEQIFGISPDRLVANPDIFFSSIHPKELSRYEAAIAHSISTKQAFEQTVRVRGGPSGYRFVRIAAALRVSDDGTRIWDGIAEDVTGTVSANDARAALEAQLREAQRMEALGTMASGVAHDFNNVLGVMLGNLAMTLEDIRREGNSAHIEALEQAQQAGFRARDLVRQILTFSQKHSSRMDAQAVSPVVEESVRLLRSTISQRASIEFACVSPSVWSLMDATQIGQVVVNLCVNAWQALDGKNNGHIRLNLQATGLFGEEAKALNVTPGQYAHLSVEDNGSGMDESTLKQVFQPFFTTKPVGEGTGLGLAVVHGIVQRHRGAISLQSKVGEGTRFDVYLPALIRLDLDSASTPSARGSLTRTTTGPALPFLSPTSVPAVIRRGAPCDGSSKKDRVLYIDDMEIMALMVQRLLSRAGYDVTISTSAQKGWDEFQREPHAWDIVVSDYNMPGLSGLEVLQLIKKLRPDLPTILTSGYVTPELLIQSKALGVTLVLEKQQTFEELGASLKAALAKVAPAPSSLH